MAHLIASGEWLPLTFAALMGLAMLLYALLDGYDLGVGILTCRADDSEKDQMIASIGPFWDANETWLVLGVGLLLVAFPTAHGLILGYLYLPVTAMLMGIILRGVAFDFRAKAQSEHKAFWNRVFFAGSLITSFSQGFMLGSYILGFATGYKSWLFATGVGLSLCCGYALIGACWLILKTEDGLQKKAVRWARHALYGTTAGILTVSVSTPLTSTDIFDKWFSFPALVLLAPIPIITVGLIVALDYVLRRLPKANDRWCWLPFVMVIGLFILCFDGLAYSFYPYIIPGQLKIVDAASAPESLKLILGGVVVVLPFLIFYTFISYKIFNGKARDLTYD